jgi:hypothetical protein
MACEVNPAALSTPHLPQHWRSCNNLQQAKRKSTGHGDCIASTAHGAFFLKRARTHTPHAPTWQEWTKDEKGRAGTRE